MGLGDYCGEVHRGIPFVSDPFTWMGDSFGLFQRFKDTATDVGPNLAYEINCPVQTLVNDGILAQQLPRLLARQGPDFLADRVAVVWIMKDIAFQDQN